MKIPHPTLLQITFTILVCLTALPGISVAQNQPPAGYTALFNGKDLAGWRGGSTFDPRKLAALPNAERAAQIEKWTATMKEHWRVENGELINDGKGDYATTERDYGDFELLVEYKTVPGADSGIYLRGCPQVQIWDINQPSLPEKPDRNPNKGSGGLFNNTPHSPGRDPLVPADKPFGEWNQFRIVMVGARVSVWLNGQQVVDHAILENYYDKERKLAVPRTGPIELQTHGGEIRWRHIFLREIGSDEADKILRSHGGEGFRSVFNGKDLEGWAGALEAAKVEDGTIVWQQGKGGNIFTNEEFADFVARVEFKLPPGGNNGLAIRYPGTGSASSDAMCESQVLDDNYEKVRGPIDPRQAHGSAYGMVAAQRGYQHPIGEWNFEEVTVKGSTIKVELNGTVILDSDLSKVTPGMFMGNHPHPGKDRMSGHFGFAGHTDPVAFRNVLIKKL